MSNHNRRRISRRPSGHRLWALTICVMLMAGACASSDDAVQAAGTTPGHSLIGSEGGLVGAITDTDTENGDDATSGDTDEGVGDNDDDTDAGVVSSALGPILTEQGGLTAYVFANDTAGRSNCADPCSVTWPPIPASAVLSPEIDAGRYGSVARDDGIEQLTLDGFPLYTFKDDLEPGDVEGQNVGDVWFAVAADGEVIVPSGMRVGSTDAGDVLIDTESFTVYAFANDSHGISTCADACSETWPPVPGDIRLGPGLDPGQFGQITRDDGTTQLTFLQHPLYRYRDDDNPGDANGLLVGEEGTWTAVRTDRLTVIDSDETFGNVIGSPSDETAVGEESVAEVPAGGDGYGDYGTEGAGTDGADSDQPMINVANTELGDVLVSGAGLTLYAFIEDTSTSSVCVDACADAWPPIRGESPVDTSAVTAEVTIITRDDGKSHLVIGGRPVYLFAGDVNAGDVNGQGSGDVWFAMAADGTLIK